MSVILGEVAVLLLLATAFTVTARKAFPVWDDAWRVLILNVEGGEIYANAKDRPLEGAIEQFLVDRGVLWQTATLVHWLAWIFIGVVTMRLWSVLFPEHRQYALPAACLAMAPLLCQTQYILLTAVFCCQVPMLMAYAAILLVWRSHGHDRPFWWKAARHCLAVILLALATLISEYALPTVAAGVTLMALAPGQATQPWRGRWKNIALLLGTTVVGYLIYWWLADVSMRPEVRPEVVVIGQSSIRNMAIMAAYLATSCWQGMLGTFLQKVSAIDCGGTVLLFATLIAGLPLACLVTLVTHYRARQSAFSDTAEIFNLHKTFMLLAALIAGILPVIIMQRVPGPATASRYWLPVLPVAACLNIYLLLSVLRPRMWWIVGPLCGFLAGYFTLMTAVPTIHELHKVASWGKSLERYVSPEGLTVAVFDDVKTPDGMEFTRDYELTARLIASWPREKQIRFWALIAPNRAVGYASGIYINQNQAPQIERYDRGVVRRGLIERLLWLRGESDGSLNIIDCRDAD